jgi:hypothetical protein
MNIGRGGREDQRRKMRILGRKKRNRRGEDRLDG